MNLGKIAWRSIQQRGLASFLTALSMALGVTLMIAILVVGGHMRQSYEDNAGTGYNLIVGGKGGRLQLVLNTVYHLSQPMEPLPYTFYKEFLPASKRKDGIDGQYAAFTEKAIPCCMGDYYQDFRVIGTTSEYFDELPDARQFTFTEGDRFKPEDYFGAVVGSVVAREAGLTVGSTISPSHGAEDGHTHDDAFTVRGVLAPSGSPDDRGVFINIEGFYLLDNHAKPVEKIAKKDVHDHGAGPHSHEEHEHADHDHEGHDHDHAHDDPSGESTPAGEATPSGETTDTEGQASRLSSEPVVRGQQAEEHDHAHDDHDHDHAHDERDPHGHDHSHGHDHHHHGHGHDHHHEPLPEEQREVTAILVRTGGLFPGAFAQQMAQDINEGQIAQAVSPVAEISRMTEVFVQPLMTVLLYLTGLIIVVSAMSILVGMYNSMNERKHGIAVMRALGASRNTVMLIVFFESILLALAGGICGWLLGHLLVGAASPWIQSQTGVYLGFFAFVPAYELALIPSLILLAALAGFVPALAAYRTDVAKSLTANP